MFSIYGIAGRVFNGPLEQMRRVRGPEAVRRISVIGDALIDFPQALQALDGDTPPGPGPQSALPDGVGGQAGAGAAGAQVYARAARGTRQPLSTVAELMSHPALTLRTGLSLALAWQALQQRRVAQAPVLDASGQLVGLLLLADLAPGPEVTDLAAHWQQAIDAVMHTPVAAVSGAAELRRVAQALLDTGYPGLPVVDDAGGVQGFIARGDILRAVTHEPPLDLWA